MRSLLGIFILPFVSEVIMVNGDTANSTCSMEMFGGDFNAYMACKIQFAHQANWYPSPLSGLFSYQEWNGYDGFWQNGLILNTFVDFIDHVENNTRYQHVLETCGRSLYELKLAYGPEPSYDDMAWYALSYARIYEVFGWNDFLQHTEEVYNYIWENGWDKTGTCGGGMWFDDSYMQKVTITNAECIQVAGKLYRFTQNKKYLTQMHQIWNWVLQNGIVDNSTYLVHDGALDNCTGNAFIGPTYLGGTLIGGLVEFYKIHKNESYIDLANKIAQAEITNTTNSTSGILREYCEPNCNDDEKMFKGIFVRNLRYLMDALDELNQTQQRQEYQDYLNFNIRANMEYNMCDKEPMTKCNITYKDGPPFFNRSGPVFSVNWSGPFIYGAPMQQTAVLDLFVAAIKPGTKCTGKYCDYSPQNPQPQPLTCKDYPCPPGQPCCEYGGAYTCCNSDQKCDDGICT